MTATKADLKGCRTRTLWAMQALNALDEEFRVWMLEHDAHATAIEYYPESDLHVFRLCPEVPPARFGVIAGNIVHQCRAALDNLIWQLVIANGKEPRGGSRGNQFPIFARLDGNEVFTDKAATALRGVHPDHRAAIEGLQPHKTPGWQGDDHPLTMLASLSNSDKHQVLEVMVVDEAARPIAVAFKGAQVTAILDNGYFPPIGRYPGAIVGWAQASPSGFHHDMYMEYAGFGRLTFQGGPPVVPFLRTLAAVVESIVRGFLPVCAGQPPAVLRLTPDNVKALYDFANPTAGRYEPFLFGSVDQTTVSLV